MNYDDLPTKGKITSDGEKIRNCHCGGRCYVSYDENQMYSVYCENGGHIVSFRTIGLDIAIKMWNDMPHTFLSKGRCSKGGAK